jgi:hypothetical protein
VAQSDPESELEEAMLKARVLMDALEAASASEAATEAPDRVVARPPSGR